MTFPAYVNLVTDKIRAVMPDVRRAAHGRRVTWSHGTQSLTVDASDDRTWWVKFDRALVYDERQNVESAIVTAQNAIAHFT
jgi:membrane-bound inhibitor of C-type lysozyme